MIIIFDNLFTLLRKHRELTLDDAKFIQRFNTYIKEYIPAQEATPEIETTRTAEIHILHPDND